MNVKPRSLSSIGIVGAGNMGSSIAVAVSSLGIPVHLIDANGDALRDGLVRIDKMFASLEKRANIAKETLQARRLLIKPVQGYGQMRAADLIIEAVSENIEVKKAVFQNLDKVCSPQTLFASNTSSLSISQLASFTRYPEKVIGLHFFNPAHLMKLVEVIPGLKTSIEITDFAIHFVQKLDKMPVKVADCASFLINRLLARYINEAIWVLQDGLADVPTIDKAACDLLMPIGPLQLRDMNGLDIGLSVASLNYLEYGERFRPPQLLEKMVKFGMLGRKSHAGFYSYGQDGHKPSGINLRLSELLIEEPPSKNKYTIDFEPIQLFLPMINEAFLLLQEKIAALEDIDPALKAGLGMRHGILQFASEYGLEKCLVKIEGLYKVYGERFRPAPLLKRYVWSGKKLDIA